MTKPIKRPGSFEGKSSKMCWTWNATWMGHKSVPRIYSHCLGCVMAQYPVSRLLFFSQHGILSFLLFFNTKIVIFGHTRTWNATWIIYSHCLGCVLAHYPVSRLNISSNMAPCHFGCFWAHKYPFLDRPGPGMTPGWGIKVSKTPFPIAWDVLWPIIMFPG